MSNLILTFDAIRKGDIAVAGGKGSNLGEMTAAGIAVPQGFVVTTESYRLFLQENGLTETIRQALDAAGDEESRLLSCAAQFRDLIRAGHIPAAVESAIQGAYEAQGLDRVAVRSSATAEDLEDASYAGQQETYLNVRGLDAVLTRVRDCYASLWGDRAVCYRKNHDVDQTQVALAVVIQEMVESETAGVLFTVNPVNQNLDEMQINASYGLGESVVSGRVTADSYICDRAGKVLSCTIGSKATEIVYRDSECSKDTVLASESCANISNITATNHAANTSTDTIERPVNKERREARCLSDREVAALCKEALTVAQHYGMPMDIEWAIRNGKVYILQARAITTLKENADAKADEARVQEYLARTVVKGPQSSNLSFLLEKMPYAYYPLDYDYMIAIDTQKGRIFGENGLVLSSDPQMDDDGVQTLPSSHIGVNRNLVHLPGTLHTLKDYDACAAKCREFMPIYERQVADLAHKAPDSMSLADCGVFLHDTWALVNNLAYDRFLYALFPSFLSSKMKKAVQKAGPAYTQYDLYRDLDNKTAVMARDVAELAGEINAHPAAAQAVLNGCNYKTLCREYPVLVPLFQTFLDRNGFKSDYNCYCLIARTLREEPDRLLQIVRPLIQTDAASSPSGTGNTASAPQKKDYASLQADLKAAYGSKYPALARDIENFRYFHVVREESQYLWETIFYYVRQVVRRTNELLTGYSDLDSGIVYLFRTELEETCKRGSLSDADRERIARRSANHNLSQRVWDASKLLVFTSDGDVLKGTSGSTGSAVGPVCVIHGPEEFYKMRKGDILVCELTDPEWTPLFSLASAVVADTGAALSHAAIVAREYGIPAVLGVGYATTRFQDGDMIRVDGDKGEVSRV